VGIGLCPFLPQRARPAALGKTREEARKIVFSGLERPAARRGLTLVETIVVIFVFALLTLTITQLLTGGIRAWKKGQAKSTLRASARTALDQVSTELRQAITFTDPSSSNDYAKKSSITFQRTTVGSLGMSTVYVSYDISGTNLVRREAGGSDVTIAENVVATDPRDGQVKSYFQRMATTDGRTWRVVVTTVENASLLSGTSPTSLESVTLSSTVYLQGLTVSGTNPPAIAQDLVVPGSLADPRGMAFRHPSRGPADLKPSSSGTIIRPSAAGVR